MHAHRHKHQSLHFERKNETKTNVRASHTHTYTEVCISEMKNVSRINMHTKPNSQVFMEIDRKEQNKIYLGHLFLQAVQI